jgi:hypothetical protein
MNKRFQSSWQLFKASIAVTLRHRKLLWFPVLTTFLTAMIALFFLSAMALPVVLHHTGYRLDQREHWVALKDHYVPTAAGQPKSRDTAAGASEALTVLLTGHSAAAGQPGQAAAARGFSWGSLLLLVVYFVSMFLATFFNVAFYSEIIAALDGRGVSFRRGLSTARGRLSSILAWSLLAGLVGWLIRTLEQRLPLAGRIVTGLIGMAWSVAAVFAIPVIIQEQPVRNPLKILQQSAMTLKRTWGEGLLGYIGFSAGSAVIFLCSLIPLLLVGAVALIFKSVGLMIVAGVIWVLGLLAMAYVSGVAGHVYRCALYKYATEGVVPEPYNQDLLDMAWKVKAGSGK